ncbi:hypothetical protein BH11BAC2_BH11BAC2_23360 [soil metagenome]
MKRKENPGRKTSRAGKPERESSPKGRAARKEDANSDAPRSKNTRGGSRPEGSAPRARKPYAGEDRGAKNPFDKEKRSPGAYNRQDRTKKGASTDARTSRKPFDNDERAPKSFDRAERSSKMREDKPSRKPFDKSDLSFRKKPAEDRPWRASDNDDRNDRKPFQKEERAPRSFDREDRPKKRFDSDEKPSRAPFDKSDLSFRKKPAEDRPWRASDNEERTPRKSFDREERSPKSLDRDERPKRSASGDDRSPRKPYDKTDSSPRRDSGSDRPRKTSTRGEAPKRAYDRKKPSGRPFEKFERPARPNRSEERAKKGYDELPGERPARNTRAPKSTGKSQGFFGIEKSNVPTEAIRLNRYISMAGICSRREADDMIEAGVVSVNGTVVTNLGSKVNPGDDVRYNGERIRGEKLVYVLLNKPKDYITTMEDPNQRHTVMELVANACSERIYPVGRLDRNTTGLLLLTNDGDLAKTLTHPSSNVRKLYMAELNKGFKVSDMKKLVEGVELDDDGVVSVDDIAYDGDGSDKKIVGLEIHSGQNRVVRRLFEKLGYDVLKLDRVMFAGLTKKDLTRGRWRFLTEAEVGMLKMISSKKMKAAKA